MVLKVNCNFTVFEGNWKAILYYVINGQSLTCQCFPSKITPSVRLFSVCPFPKDSWEWRAIGGLFAQNALARNPFL